MAPAEVRELIAVRPWLIVPVGTTEGHGSALPLGCDSMVVERLADDLSARFRVPRAPTLEFGVNYPRRRAMPGSAGLKRKTLHRLMNELIECWETWANVREFVILTAQRHEPHQEALSTIRVAQARVQVVDIFALDWTALFGRALGADGEAELETALVGFVAPALLQLSAPDPTGEEMYRFMLERIADRCFRPEA